MSQIPQKTNWGPVLILGGLWGLSEAALGMFLRQCASTVSGSLMTGAALFSWPRPGRSRPGRRRRPHGRHRLGLQALRRPAPRPARPPRRDRQPHLRHRHGGRGLRPHRQRHQRPSSAAKAVGQGLAGGLAALVSVNLFPLVKYATGVAPCVTGTSYPLSLYYAPIAVAVSALTVPLGFRAGAAWPALEGRPARLRWLSPAALALSLGALALLRLL